MILKHHPWVAKGEHYLSLLRDEKSDVLWSKIIENDEMGKNWHNEVTRINVSSVFDEHGDEMDCRHKTISSQGNVGKIVWEDLGGHNYTGVFQGGDTGFIRLSSPFNYKKPGERR